MKTLIPVILILFVIVSAAAAQESVNLDARKAEMKKVEKLIGQWKGGGWIMHGQTRETFTGGEIVQGKLEGLATLVEGRFVNAEGKVIHQTLAVLSAGSKTDTFNFATYLANGATGVHDLKIVGDAYEWGFKTPDGGTVRYTIKISNDTWFEIGEFSRDAKTWLKIFEMDLKRVK